MVFQVDGPVQFTARQYRRNAEVPAFVVFQQNVQEHDGIKRDRNHHDTVRRLVNRKCVSRNGE